MLHENEDRRKTGADHDLLIRIDQNLTNFIQQFNEHEDKDKEKFDSHSKRIMILERAFWCSVGAFAVGKAVFSFFIK